MNIIKAFGTTNTDYYSKTLQRKYIVLHYTAGTRSVKGSARNVASMFKNGSVGGSADFIVDDSEIVQYNGDISHRACWSVGGKKYSSMTTSEGGRYYGICTNSNSINIECGQELHQNRVVQPCRPETHRGTAQCPAGHHRRQTAEGGTLFGQHGHDEGTLQTVDAEHLRFRYGEPVLQGNRQLCPRYHPECAGTDKDGQQGEVHQPALLPDGTRRAGDGNTAAGGQLRKHREQCEDSQSAQGRRHCREEERRL